MLSLPPDSTFSALPALMMSCASMVAFMPEPQTLLTVVAPVASGSPAPRAACRAGAWPCPAGSTLPMKTSSMRSGASFARSSAAPITCAPSLCALNGDNSPMNRPSGVRAAERMTTGSALADITGSPVRSLLYDDNHIYADCNGMLLLSANEALPDRPPGEIEEAKAGPAHPHGGGGTIARRFGRGCSRGVPGPPRCARCVIGSAKGLLELRPYGELWQER